MATIDHLCSRLDPERLKRTREPKTVLSCYQCNQKRSIKEQAALTPEEKVRLSQQRRKKRRPKEHRGLEPTCDIIEDKLVFEDHTSFNRQLGYLHRILNYALNIIRDNGVSEKEQTEEQTEKLEKIVEQIRLSLLGMNEIDGPVRDIMQKGCG